MSEIHLNPYVFKVHTKPELIKLYAGFITTRLDLFTYLCLHFKKEDLKFIADCFLQMNCCWELEFEYTSQMAQKGKFEYAIIYPPKK